MPTSQRLIFKNVFYLLFLCVLSMSVLVMHLMCVQDPAEARRGPWILRLELQTVVSCHAGPLEEQPGGGVLSP